jgi:hypothetical protein
MPVTNLELSWTIPFSGLGIRSTKVVPREVSGSVSYFDPHYYMLPEISGGIFKPILPPPDNLEHNPRLTVVDGKIELTPPLKPGEEFSYSVKFGVELNPIKGEISWKIKVPTRKLEFCMHPGLQGEWPTSWTVCLGPNASMYPYELQIVPNSVTVSIPEPQVGSLLQISWDT